MNFFALISLAGSAAERLQRSHHELQDFLFAASHHLQEPLRKVRTISSRLLPLCEQAGVQRARDYLERIDRGTAWMQTLLEGLRAYLAVDPDPSRWTAFDLTTLLREVVLCHYDEIARSGAAVSLRDLPRIQADRGQIATLFDHLLRNALVHGVSDRPLRISITGRSGPPEGGDTAAESSGQRVCEIWVEDNGVGFEDRYRERIFGVFQRLGTGNARDVGAGIGLAVCRKIVEGHGGAIAARGRPGEGATFLIRMPVALPPEA